MGGRGTHVACTLTLTVLSHFGHHRAVCTSTEKGSVGPEIVSALGVPGLYRCARARRTKVFPGGLACAARLARSSLATVARSGAAGGGARRTRGAAKGARGVERKPKKMARPGSPAPGDTGITQRLCLAWTWAREMKNENVSLARSLALARSAKGSRSRRKHARGRGRAGWLT